MNFGLKTTDLTFIVDQISGFEEIDKAAIFGSRARGNYKNGSDVDIAIYGENITFNTISRMHYILEEEGPMPYLVDVIDYTHLTHAELKEHIDRVGKVIFDRIKS
jgi:predicted nucleotidyltransferase